MKLSDWFDGFDFALEEIWCPKCNEIIFDMTQLKKWYNKNENI
jgi:hypothetical protein